MRDRLTAALDRLKSASGKKGGFLYDQPWYVIIGPPGSGKTTALANSGLDFPLSDGGKLQGVGGTRFCEWWLTDTAVLIDTGWPLHDAGFRRRGRQGRLGNASSTC
jgi:type VI secretion system protein ImpL